MSTANYLLPYQGNSSHEAQEATVPQQGRKKYTVAIEEHIVQEFPVEAHDVFQALQTAREAYSRGSFVVQPDMPVARLMMARDDVAGEETEWDEF